MAGLTRILHKRDARRLSPHPSKRRIWGRGRDAARTSRQRKSRHANAASCCCNSLHGVICHQSTFWLLFLLSVVVSRPRPPGFPPRSAQGGCARVNNQSCSDSNANLFSFYTCSTNRLSIYILPRRLAGAALRSPPPPPLGAAWRAPCAGSTRRRGATAATAAASCAASALEYSSPRLHRPAADAHATTRPPDERQQWPRRVQPAAPP